MAYLNGIPELASGGTVNVGPTNQSYAEPNSRKYGSTKIAVTLASMMRTGRGVQQDYLVLFPCEADPLPAG